MTVKAALQSSDLAAIDRAIVEAEATAPRLRAEAEATRRSAVDPLLSGAEAQAMRRSADASIFEAERAEAALAALVDHRGIVHAAQIEAERVSQYRAAQSAVAASQAVIAAHWDTAALTLAKIVLQIEAASSAAEAANADLPQNVAAIAVPVAWAEARYQVRRIKVSGGMKVLSETEWRDDPGSVPAHEIKAQMTEGRNAKQ